MGKIVRAILVFVFAVSLSSTVFASDHTSGGDGALLQGWKQMEGKWYYFNKDGFEVKDSWIGDYYVGQDGAMLTDTWIVDKIGTSPKRIAYYVGNDGRWVEGKTYHGCSGAWVKDSVGWWFQKADGMYPKAEFEYIDNHWYLFDESGYMQTGFVWNQETGRLHYFYPDGRLAIDAGWVAVSDREWIYVEGSSCIVDSMTPDGYFVDKAGIWNY